MSVGKSDAQLCAEVAAALLKSELEGADVGAKVTLADRENGVLATIEHPASHYRETIAYTRYGATPVESCPFTAPRSFMAAMKRAIGKAKRMMQSSAKAR